VIHAEHWRWTIVNRDHWTPYAFLAAPVTIYLVWVIIPIVQTMVLSLSDWDGVSSTLSLVGFDNYKRLLSDPYFIRSLKNNVTWIVAFVFLSLPIGLAMAMLFNNSMKGSRLFKTLIYLPMTLSFVVVGQVWSWILEPKYGALNTFLRFVGLDSLARPWLSDLGIVTYSVIAAALWRQVSYSMILFLAGLQNVPREQVEAALVDGANGWQRFRYVILPALWPSTVVTITVSIIDSLRAFDIVHVLTRGGPFYSSSVIANYMYIQAFNNYRMGYGSAIAVVQFLMTLVFILAYLASALRREVDYT